MSIKKVIKNSFVNLSLTLISLFICFILLELGFRLAGYQAIYDTYSKSSLLWQYDPLLGWSHIPNSEADYIGPRPWPVEFSSSIHINSDGLRGPEVGPKKSLRILILGDSLTAGFEVPYEETYAAQLQEILSKQLNKPVQVINAGVRGYGTDQSYLYYKERGKELGADMILFLHVSNDPLNNITLHRMRRPFGKPVFQLNSENNQEKLKLVGYPTPKYTLCSEYRLNNNYEIKAFSTQFTQTLCWLQMTFTDYSAFFTYVAFKIRQHPELLRKLYFTASPDKSGEIKLMDRPKKALSPIDAITVPQNSTLNKKPEEKSIIKNNLAKPDKLTTLIIEQFAKTAAENKTQFILLTSADHSPFQMDQNYLLKNNIDILNIETLYKDQPMDRYIFKNDSHWNSLGHKAFAEKIALELLKIIPPEPQTN